MQQIDKWKKPFHVERGDIYMADLGTEEDVVGSEQFGVRPVVITSRNSLNRSSPTAIVAVVTSEIKRLDLDTHVLLSETAGLPKRSMVCAEQRFTIDKKRLIKYCCRLDKKTMGSVTRACHRAEEEDKKRRKF